MGNVRLNQCHHKNVKRVRASGSYSLLKGGTPPDGLEPSTFRLTAERSAIELRGKTILTLRLDFRENYGITREAVCQERFSVIMMASFTLRSLKTEEWHNVAELITVSTNFWYRTHGFPAIFTGESSDALLFPEVYETLDPGCCLVAVNEETETLVASCFYHPRNTHVSLGIMNVHPNYAGKGLARKLLSQIIALAEERDLPLRLVSSAMNLDSFALYTRAGFVPRATYQLMVLPVPDEGLPCVLPEFARVRSATPEDLPAIVALELEKTGLDREKDYRLFLENKSGIWKTFVLESEMGRGKIDGVLASVSHPAARLLGPGVADTQAQAAALLHAQWNVFTGQSPVFLVPVTASWLVKYLYALGARNCELYFVQCRGEWHEPVGIVFPTFMPE